MGEQAKSLRDFQTEIFNRLAHKNTLDMSVMRMAIISGADRLLLDMADFEEIVEFDAKNLTRVPSSKGYVMGAVDIHGKVFCVINLWGFLHQTKDFQSGAGFLIVVHKRHSMNAAVFVDRVVGMRNITDMEASGAVFVDHDGQEWSSFSVDRLNG